MGAAIFTLDPCQTLFYAVSSTSDRVVRYQASINYLSASIASLAVVPKPKTQVYLYLFYIRKLIRSSNLIIFMCWLRGSGLTALIQKVLSQSIYILQPTRRLKETSLYYHPWNQPFYYLSSYLLFESCDGAGIRLFFFETRSFQRLVQVPFCRL